MHGRRCVVVANDVPGFVANRIGVYGIVLGGWQMARAALAAQKRLDAGEGDAAFYRAKIGTARFFADHFVAQSGAMRAAIVDGHAGVLALPEAMF